MHDLINRARIPIKSPRKNTLQGATKMSDADYIILDHYSPFLIFCLEDLAGQKSVEYIFQEDNMK